MRLAPSTIKGTKNDNCDKTVKNFELCSSWSFVRSAIWQCWMLFFFTLITSVAIAVSIVLIIIVAIRRRSWRWWWRSIKIIIDYHWTRCHSIAHFIHKSPAITPSIAIVMMAIVVIVMVVGRRRRWWWHGRIKMSRIRWSGNVVVHPIILTRWIVIVRLIGIVKWWQFCCRRCWTCQLRIISD